MSDEKVKGQEMKSEPHIHKFERKDTKLLVHKYNPRSKKEGPSTATDTLKQRVCACSKVETFDLERRKR